MIGDLYKLRVPCLGNPADTIGVVFHEYVDFDVKGGVGIQVIFKNGEYDGFSVYEQENFLTFVGHSVKNENYEFVNVLSVSKDYRKGRWDEDFKPN